MDQVPTEFASDPIICELLVHASVDYVYLAELPSYARSFGAVDSAEERHRLMQVLGDLLRRGLWRAGHLSADGFEPWECPVDEVLARIEQEWASLRRPLQLGDVCWFASTPEGDRMARRLLADGYQSVVKA